MYGKDLAKSNKKYVHNPNVYIKPICIGKSQQKHEPQSHHECSQL